MRKTYQAGLELARKESAQRIETLRKQLHEAQQTIARAADRLAQLEPATIRRPAIRLPGVEIYFETDKPTLRDFEIVRELIAIHLRHQEARSGPVI